MGNETGTQGQQNAEGQQNNANQQNTAGQQKTFTQEELDSIIAERLGRERQKYADYDSLKQKAGKYDEQQEANKTELQKATERAEKAEQEIAAMKQANSIREIRSKISKETGVPENLLTADTEEDCKSQAEAIKAFATPKNNLNLPDGGEAGGSHKQTTAEQFGEWFGQVTNQS